MNSELRISANLEPISDEIKQLGVGGSENYFSSTFNIRDLDINNLIKSVDKMINEVQFEKAKQQR